jgi:hypothetical protein
MAPKYAGTLSDFQRREVLANLGRMIGDPTYVPQFTTVGEGKLVFTDTSSLNITGVSLANTHGTGTLGVTVGGIIDSYEFKMTPSQDPAVLKKQHDLYSAALYSKHIIYWTTGRNPNPPPCNAISLGTHGGHELWTCDPHKFTALVFDLLAAQKKVETKDKTAKTSGDSSIPGVSVGPTGRPRVTQPR